MLLIYPLSYLQSVFESVDIPAINEGLSQQDIQEILRGEREFVLQE